MELTVIATRDQKAESESRKQKVTRVGTVAKRQEG